jgi:2-iminobutanoate/2-iminopropanoate deaminase
MGELAADDVASQTRQALANVETALAANGTSMDDVIRVGVFLTDVEDFSAMNEVYRAGLL